MAYPKNETKARFKELFKVEIEKLNRGSTLYDTQIKDFVKHWDLKIPYSEVQALIRALELELGMIFKKRLKRIRNEGFLILEPEEQVHTALKEGQARVEIALKKTGHRLEAVDPSNFTEAQKRELLSRTSAVDSLLSIIENSSVNRKIVNRREVELLSCTAASSKALKRIEKE
jgi:hypothetical protein